MTVLVALITAAPCWGFLEWGFEGDGSHVDYLPASEAAPWASGMVITASERRHCSQNGAVCSRLIYVRTSLTPAAVGETLRSHGWSEECHQVSGILSHLDLYRYGYRCLSVIAGPTHGVVVVSLLGQADWWFHFRNDPDPLG